MFGVAFKFLVLWDVYGCLVQNHLYPVSFTVLRLRNCVTGDVSFSLQASEGGGVTRGGDFQDQVTSYHHAIELLQYLLSKLRWFNKKSTL